MAKTKTLETVTHTFPPCYDETSEILLLGSIPSRKSREENFYYMHPSNRFWKVMAQVYQEEEPKTTEEKKCFLKRKKIALWDVIDTCDIYQSADDSITNVIPNDIKSLLPKTHIKKIYTTGKKAHVLYQKYLKPTIDIDDIPLPSTSSANIANFTFDQLVEAYQKIKEK